MPTFVAALIGGLAMAAGNLAGRVLLALGFSYVAYTGINATLTALKAQVVADLQSMPALWVQLAGVLKIDVAINILFSALVARLVLQGLTSDTVKRLVLK